MNGTYLLLLGIGAVLCTGLFAYMLKRQGVKTAAAWVALPIAVVLGVVLSKASYFLLDFQEVYENYGFGALLRTRPSEFSLIGACAGVTLAVLLAARLMHQPAVRVLDAFAPCGALMIAVERACEYFLDPMNMVGMGDYVAEEALQFFPVAVHIQDFYSWFYAVFMMEAAFALICAVAGFVLTHRRSFAPGRVFLHTAFFLALPQIFSERMLNQCMRWGFVRIEQILCAVVVFAVILWACIRYRGKGAYLPAILDLLCIGVLVDIEFTLDNKPPFGLEMAPATCYALMILTLCCMAALSVWAYRRLNRQA